MLQAVGAALIRRAQRGGLEFAATFDLNAGAPLGGVLTGMAQDVPIGPHVRLMQPGRRYVALQTHLTGAAFSDLDAAVLLANPPIRAIAVVALDGTWYILSKAAGRPSADPAAAVGLVRAAVIAVRGAYRTRVAAGEMTADEAKRRILHEVWQFIGPRLGLRYDRVVTARGGQ